MKCLLAIVSIFFLSVPIIHAQQLQLQIVESKVFDANQKPYDSIPLTWRDFKAITPASTGWTAVTNTNTSYNCRIVKTKDVTKVKYIVKFYFDRIKSNKLNNNLSNYILQHEQLHFAIAWYHYQQFLADIKATSFTIANYNTLFKQKFQTYLDNANLMQTAYDAETEHSIVETKQAEWAEKVRQLLLQLH